MLDRLGIDMEFANRVAMGRGLDAAHFRWVPFDDALLFPLNNDALAAETPDRKFFFGRENMLLARYRRELGVAAMPATLAEYASRVVTPELERQKKDGAVAIKFEAAYLRSLDFEPASEQDAAAIYAKYAHGGSPAKEDYTRLQDYLFRYVAAEAGRLGLPVHIHTGAGCGGYFYLSGSNPVLLESVLNDARLRKTTFVLLHGGAGPFSREISILLMKPNVYTDLSEQTWLESPRRLAEVLRDWIEWYPEKISVRNRSLSRKRRLRLGGDWLADFGNRAAGAGNCADRHAPGRRDHRPARQRNRAHGPARKCAEAVPLEGPSVGRTRVRSRGSSAQVTSTKITSCPALNPP